MALIPTNLNYLMASGTLLEAFDSVSSRWPFLEVLLFAVGIVTVQSNAMSESRRGRPDITGAQHDSEVCKPAILITLRV
jgi:hypothetical protein